MGLCACFLKEKKRKLTELPTCIQLLACTTFSAFNWNTNIQFFYKCLFIFNSLSNKTLFCLSG